MFFKDWKANSQLFALTALLLVSKSAASQLPNNGGDNRATSYQNLLDAIFPYPPNFRGGVCRIVVRLAPTSHSEAQFTVIVHPDGTADAVLYTIPSPSAWKITVDNAKAKGRQDIPELVKLLHLTKRTGLIPANKMNSFRLQLNQAIAASASKLAEEADVTMTGGGYTVVLDGTAYDFQFTQAGSAISWHFADLEVGNSGAVYRWPLVLWINQLYSYILEQNFTVVPAP